MRFALALVLGALTLGLGAQTNTSREDRTAILRYGIESEVLELVKALRQEKNTDYRDLTIEAWTHARTDELQDALLLLFLETKDDGLVDQAAAVLAEPDKKANSLLLDAVSYLADRKSPRAEEVFTGLMKDKNKVLALAAIRSLAKIGATRVVKDLVDLYEDAETDPNFRPDLVWTFGELKAKAAVELLLKEYEDREDDALLRRAILEALGKIGDDRGWALVEAALADTNADLRAAAIGALNGFPRRGDRDEVLTSALRDSQVGVRLAAAATLKAEVRPALHDLVLYRVRKDPEARVRVACLQALAAYENGPAEVLAFLADRKTDISVWKEALNLAVTHRYPKTLETLVAVVTADNKDKNSSLAGLVAQAVLPHREPFRTLFGLLLDNDKPAVRTTALRAIGLGRFTEYEGRLKELVTKDPDPGVKAQAQALIKEFEKNRIE